MVEYCIPYNFWQFLIMAVGLTFISFWQKRPVELNTIGSWPALWRGPSTVFGVFATPQFVPVLFTVYLLQYLLLKVPGL